MKCKLPGIQLHNVSGWMIEIGMFGIDCNMYGIYILINLWSPNVTFTLSLLVGKLVIIGYTRKQVRWTGHQDMIISCEPKKQKSNIFKGI
jgi:hypothetical protein